MDLNLILGALIAITSGVIIQTVSSHLEMKREKRKFVFEKIVDIINSVSAINEGLQQDAATTFGVGYPNVVLKDLGLELIKIKCLVKIFHPSLGNQVDNYEDSMNQYFAAKREFIILQRGSASKYQLNQQFEIIKEKFELCIQERERFIDSLIKYSSKIVV